MMPSNEHRLDPASTNPVAQPTDAELLERFRSKRDESSFRELVRRHAGLVLSAARRQLGSEADLAEDAAQQAFVVLVKNAAKAAAAPILGAWLHRVVVFEAKNLLRSERRHRLRILQAPQPTPSSEPNPGLKACIDEALAALPEVDRALIWQHHGEGRPYHEISRQLGLSEAAAQKRGHRALEKLALSLRRRRILVTATALTASLGSLLAPAPVSASTTLANRALAAGAKIGTSGGILAGWFTSPILGTAAAIVCATAGFFAIRHFKVKPVILTENAVLAPAGKKPETLALSPSSTKTEPDVLPDTSDANLTEDQKQFIALAQKDPADALAWARKKFPANNPLFAFLQTAVRRLADRDMLAAERMLTTDAQQYGIWKPIFDSKRERNFRKAIQWADEWYLARPELDGISSVLRGSWELTPTETKFRDALVHTQSPIVRATLIAAECERLMMHDDTALESYAAQFEGLERRCILDYHVSVLLQRGDPRATEALASVKPTTLINVNLIAMRNPEIVLDWHMTRTPPPQGNQFYQTASELLSHWIHIDATSAEAWYRRYSEKELQDRSVHAGLYFKRKGT